MTDEHSFSQLRQDFRELNTSFAKHQKDMSESFSAIKESLSDIRAKMTDLHEHHVTLYGNGHPGLVLDVNELKGRMKSLESWRDRMSNRMWGVWISIIVAFLSLLAMLAHTILTK